MIETNPRNKQVIYPIINGRELNSHPLQEAQRNVICFWNWTKSAVTEYPEPLQYVANHVKDHELLEKDENVWWRFLRPRMELYSKLWNLEQCFVAAATTKYLNFSAFPTTLLFSHAVKVFATNRWDLYALVQSTLHESWARKYSGALKQDLRYSPSDCFETFAFPADLWQVPNGDLASAGERYHDHRCKLMQQLWLGLTDLYNLFHNPDLSAELVAGESKQPTEVAADGYAGILTLRQLHVALDSAVATAYGWADLDLGHGFHAVDTLPEDDRVRYTISPGARQEVLRRLLALNHERAAEEKLAAPASKRHRARRTALAAVHEHQQSYLADK